MEVHRRSIDLTTVEEMDEQEYQDLLRYVGQWDEPATPDQLAELRKARGEGPEPGETPVEEVQAAAPEKPKPKKAHTPKT